MIEYMLWVTKEENSDRINKCKERIWLLGIDQEKMELRPSEEPQYLTRLSALPLRLRVLYILDCLYINPTHISI